MLIADDIDRERIDNVAIKLLAYYQTSIFCK